MNKDMTKITEVYVLNQLRKDDTDISELIKRTYGKNTLVTRVHTSYFYETPFGPANLVSQHKDKRHVLVCINKEGFSDVALDEVARTGNPHIITYKNSSGKLEGFIIGSFSETETPRIQKKNLTAALTKGR